MVLGVVKFVADINFTSLDSHGAGIKLLLHTLVDGFIFKRKFCLDASFYGFNRVIQLLSRNARLQKLLTVFDSKQNLTSVVCNLLVELANAGIKLLFIFGEALLKLFLLLTDISKDTSLNFLHVIIEFLPLNVSKLLLLQHFYSCVSLFFELFLFVGLS